MNSRTLIRCIGVLALGPAMLIGCAKSEPKPEPVGMANPAAVYCEKHGMYNLDTGMCKLSSGEEVDAWEYFREHHKEGPDSAARFCEAMGGGYMPDTRECALPDGKVMDAEEYFRDHQMTGAGG
ncbi:DUF333 domain-containing protein [Vibrio maritimus]|uniref:DUF333 domain-containing protein n=1 Tax=Vibrio maritimus TaxID=990268 RepID=UPI0040694376